VNRAAALAVLLACASIGASATLHAQGRGPAARAIRSDDQQVEKSPLVLDEADRARKTAELGAWLGTMIGRYRVNAKIFFKLAGLTKMTQGTAVCSQFGKGPGVRCVIHGTHPQKEDESHSDITLPLMYFGISPDALEIQLVMVDLEQVWARSGVLAGDKVDFSDNWKVCHKFWSHCWSVDEITAKPEGEIFMKIAADKYGDGGRRAPFLLKSEHDVAYELHLLRQLQIDAEKVP
jgi:hypothetical protein